MSNCYLQIGVTEDTRFGTIEPLSVKIDHLIPADHDFLFQFLDFDLYKAESPLSEYLTCLESGKEAKSFLAQSAITALQQMHPYYIFCRENAVLLINRAIIAYIGRRFPDADDNMRHDMFQKVSLKDYSIYRELDEILAFGSMNSDNQHVLGSLFDLQKEMRRWVFITLDDTNADLASLSEDRRSALYSLISPYDEFSPILSFNTHFFTRPSQRMKLELARWDFPELNDDGSVVEPPKKTKPMKNGSGNAGALNTPKPVGQELVRQCLDELYYNPSASLPTRLREAVRSTIDVDNLQNDDFDVISYDLSDFSDVLKLEVYRMIVGKTHIKRCKNCGKYFTPDKSNREYCNRLAPNSTKLCSEIGRSRVNTRKNSQDASTPYALYRKAYKTHFARVANGLLSQEDFDQWKTAALEKKALVETQRMDIADYEQWLRL